MIEAKSKIKVLKSAIELSELMIKVWTERLDPKYIEAHIREQLKILNDTNKRLVELRGYREAAPKEIERLKKSIRYDKKQLVLLENLKLIEKLKKMREKLENQRDAEDNSDKEVS